MVEMDVRTGGFKEGKKVPQYVAALSACLGAVAAGAVMGWLSNISEGLEDGDYNNIIIDDTGKSWIGSLMNIGAMIMCFPIGFICDKIGRKIAMLLLIIPFMLGWLIIIFATNIEMLYAGRFITGLICGAFCISVPLYTSEIAQKEVRGALGSYFQLLLTVGILFAYVMGYAVNPKTHTLICACLPLLFGIIFFFQPESPVYCIKKGKLDEARKSLIRLRGKDYDVEAEIKEITFMLEENNGTTIPFKESIKKTATKKAAIIAFGMMFFQQLSGVNAVIVYTGDIFSAANSSLTSKEATMIVGTMQVLATFVSSLVIDKLGRKILMIGSDIFMAISAIMLGVYFTIQDTTEGIGFLPIFAMCLYIVVFSLGYGPIPWIISSEVFPAEIKTVASSAAGTFNWFLAFIVTKFYFDLKVAIGNDGTFYMFAGISVIGTLFIIFFVPETKGKSFDEIQRILSGEKVHQSEGIENKGYST
ncbi:PREDICTED: facilitated trehalose transporter Tret1-like [Nicrophorus vespilloides]|uniref:Facilitated trehalose transporter Tret1-like n=1 Tax=Nicrophorus vespilloides TaxID=110193 RepID=A0ABM1MHN4_NICVS|nr:PREDICTED: facilitated trehalose transporter Tret1-like [Nicrophorus vespilloides]